ncbi:MAG: S-layer homology domain-containing protein [bacterium]|nr:S-layer homology domain-containing protein [bacterium]
MVRRLGGLVVVVIAASVLVAVPAAGQESDASATEALPLDATPDDDAPAGDTDGTHKPAIDALAGQGLFEGTLCGVGEFCPDEPVARSTAAVWLVRALGEDPPAVSTSRFADVDAEQWWARFVERLAALDVATGCERDPLRYCPDAAVTRGRLATMLVRAFDLEPASSAAYSDTAGNPHEADIDALAAARIATGCGTAPLRFCPDDVVTRGELATLLARALGLVPLAVEFGWTLPSHCYRSPPDDPHAPPEEGCPVWWSHLLDLEPSEEGITVAEMQARLAAALPNYVPKHSHRLDRLSGSAREVITATLTRLAAEDPPTLARVRTVSAKPDVCRGYGACALRYGINFERAYGAERWMWTVQTVVHEWTHLRDFSTAPGTGYSLLWCDRIAERLSAAESTGRLVTHMALLEAASPAHSAPLASGPGCADALIARIAPEVRSHDRLGKILELSANAQTQAWMRRGFASAEARWWAAEAAAGFPEETQPLENPLPWRPLPEPPAEPDEPGDCNDAMHDHPYREGVRHYHRGGLDPHTHHRWHVLVDGVAVPAGLASSEADYCEYPDGRRAIGGYTPGTSAGEIISFVSYRMYAPDGKWYYARSFNCVSIATPGHPRHDPSVQGGYAVRQPVCDDETEHIWINCESRTSPTRCPDEDGFADGEYDGDWVACGERHSHGHYHEICRATTGQPRA